MIRTPSVKWRLHNHAHRSRSMETVLCTERFSENDVDDYNDSDDVNEGDNDGDDLEQQKRLNSHNSSQ